MIIDKPSDKEPQSKEVVRVSYGDTKDTLRSIFHLIVGRPDSVQKILRREVCVSPAALIDLNERVIEKLKTHHTDGLVVSVDLTFDDKTTIQFGGWAEFQSFRWTTPKISKELRIRWQFLLAIQGYEVPQQHALMVKLNSDARPIEVLQAVLSKHPDDLDSIDLSFAPTVCRVDFISHILSQELIAVVEDWNSGLPTPEVGLNFMHKLKRHKDKIAQTIHYVTPALFALATIGYLRLQFRVDNPAAALTSSMAVYLMQWLMFSLIIVFIADKVAAWLAHRCLRAIDDYGRFCMFRLTNGDSNQEQRIDKKNAKLFVKFISSSAWSFGINVMASIFVVVTWPGLGAVR